MRYGETGVDYDVLDAFKRACQKAAAATAGALAARGAAEPPAVRGESAYLVDAGEAYIAHVEEGLGTKNLVADAVLERSGRSFYRNIGIDLVATIVNDVATCGALPLSVAMHAAAGSAEWFRDARRCADLAEGFAEGCRLAGAAWGGGETAVLSGVVEAGSAALAGSAVGRISPKTLRVAGDVRDGDAIVLLASRGVQTNGLSLCRAIAARLPDGYGTPVGDGRAFGEALLDPSVIYVRFVEACQRSGIALRYLVHITGHGWRKLMRLEEPFVYRVDKPPAEPLLFKFLRERGPVDPKEAYATFNMGAGFAAYVRLADADRCVRAALNAGYDAWVGGTVRKDGVRKAVEIAPAGITFDAETLRVR